LPYQRPARFGESGFNLGPHAPCDGITGVPIKPTILIMPIPILFLAMFALGFGLLISSFAVYYADVAEMYQIVVTAWMYLSPVIYVPSVVPETTGHC
jgi:ABC-type polysaccharide/polyol phosphate export permease